MNQKINLAIAVIWMVCCSVMARGQTITSTIPDTICVGESGTYAIAPPVTGATYSWTVTPPLGNISGSNMAPSVLILWGMPGTSVVSVSINAGGVITVLTKAVVIMPAPQPFITANITVGCQVFDSIRHKNGVGSYVDDGNGCVKVCEGSVVTYTGHGPAGSHYAWLVTGGTVLTAAADTCVVKWGTPGSGHITVIDTSAYGCIGTKSVCIDIIEKPHAFFYAVPDPSLTTINICKGATVVFKDSSTGSSSSPIVSWFWNWGDGSTYPSASSTSLTHTFHTPGIDTVTLIVKNACGCTDTFRTYVNVNPSTGVEIVCPHLVCEGDTASYCLSPVPPCPSFNWSVLGGTIVSNRDSCITVKWDHVDSTGFGYVTFDPAPCAIPCPMPTVVKVPVVLHTGYVFGPKIVCDNSQYVYSLPQWPTTEFTWTISGTTSSSIVNNDQNNQIVLNTHGTGIVNLDCHYYNTLLGCDGYAHVTIQVLPQDSITGPDKVCRNTAGGTYTLAGGGLATWTLTNPVGTVIGTSTSAGYVTPVLTTIGTYVLNASPVAGSPFCPPPGFLIKVVGLPPSPDSLLGPDTTCFGSPARFYAKKAVPGSVFQWAAVTGTCNFPSGEHTDVTFTGASPATIMVWREGVEAPHCHSDTVKKLVYRPKVKVKITGLDTVCPSTRVTYDAGYHDGETYEWKVFSPGMGSVDTNGRDTARILWNNTPGIALVTLKMRKCDSNYLDTFKVYVRSLPAVSITVSPNPVCRDAPFTASVGTITSGTVDWDWGDGSSHGSGLSTTHAYHDLAATNTIYDIVATITNPFGCVGSVTGHASITVLPAPVAFISPAGPLSFCGSPVNTWLTATLTSGFVPTDMLQWMKVGGGTLPSCPPPFTCNPYHAIAPGDYYVIAIGGGTNHCPDTSNVVHIDTACGPTPPGPCTLTPAGWVKIDTGSAACGSVHLSGSYATAGLTAFSWVWGWPPSALGVTTTNTTLDCYFATAGSYHFTYTVGFADAAGDTCYLVHDTTMIVQLIAGMRHSVSCGGGAYTVTLYDNSNYYPPHAPTKYSWYVDGAHVANTVAPVSNYSLPLPAGGHTLGVWVYYNSNMDSCYGQDTVYLDTLPVAGFSFHRPVTCVEQASVLFTNSSIPVIGLTYLWDFDDFSTNSSKDPYKVYNTPGLYYVNLTVVNRYGCSSSAVKPVNIISKRLDGKLSGDSVVCSGQIATLNYNNNFGFFYPDDYYWMSGLDTIVVNTSNTINVFNSGSYWVHGEDHYGCYVNTPPFNVTIIQTPPAVITGGADQCVDASYTLSGWAGSDPSITYQWFKNGTLVGTSDSYTDPAAVAGTDVYQLIVCGSVMGVTCCDTSALFTVTVHPPPPVPVISPIMLDCNLYSIQFTASGPSWGWYNWSNGMSGQTITVLGGGPYRVWYTDTFGCVNHGDIDFPKDPRLYLWIFPTGCFDFCDTSLSWRYVVGPIIPWAYWAYQYDPVGPVLASGGWMVPAAPIPGPGAYDLILDNGYCRDTARVLDISTHSCSNDTLECACITTKLSSYNTKCPQSPQPGCCEYYVNYCVTNECEEMIDATVTISNGFLSPSTIPIAPGFQCFTLRFIPTGLFTGGWQYVTTTWTDHSGAVHKCVDSVYIKPCNQVVRDCKCLEKRNYTAYTAPCVQPVPGCCRWYLSLCLDNACQNMHNTTAYVTITGGTLTSSTILLPYGPSCDTFEFVPGGSFSGGWQTVTLTYMDAQGMIHVCEDQVFFPPCRFKREGGGGDMPAASQTGPLLSLVPNPAQNTTRIDYALASGSSGSIQVFDIMGRLVDSHECSNTQGSWQLKLDNFVSGIYVVVLKENNAAVQQVRLSIIR